MAEAKKTAPAKASPKATGKKGAAAKTVKPAAKRAKGKAAVSHEDRQRMISEAAYFRAERRGFSGGDAQEDWVEAEREVEQLLEGNPKKAARKRPDA